MEILKATFVPAQDAASQRAGLRAYCTAVVGTHLRSVVIRDLKVVEGRRGLFLAFPARVLALRCPSCAGKIQVGSRYCMWCGVPQPPEPEGMERRHTDVIHPINQATRNWFQETVLEAWEKEHGHQA